MSTEKWKKKNVEKVRKYRRDWYHRNVEHTKQKIVSRRQFMREWFLQLKSTLQCEKCEENHPATLAFHHNNPSEKKITLANAVARAWSKTQIMAEIKKCSVLCHNCHAKFHWKQIYESTNDGRGLRKSSRNVQEIHSRA